MDDLKVTQSCTLVKRFVCFGFLQYYPSGGLGDIFSGGGTFDEALEKIKRSMKECEYEYYEILDMKTGMAWTVED